MPVFLIIGVLVCLYALAQVGLFVYCAVQELLGHRGTRERQRIDREAMSTVRQIDQLTEQAVSAMLSEAMQHKLRGRQ